MTDIPEHIKELVERMLETHRNFKLSKIPEERLKLKQQIDTLDKQIASQVYKLYGLSEEEIEIVKNFTN